jgi:hypothetical protein
MSSRKSPSGQSAKDVLRELKRRGLYTGAIKRGKPSSYQYEVVRKLRGALQGIKAGTHAIVKVDRKAARHFRSKSNDRVIVQKSSRKEKLRFDKTLGEVVGSYKAPTGKRITRIAMGNIRKESDVPFKIEGKRITYKFGTHGYANRQELIKAITKYGEKFENETSPWDIVSLELEDIGD